MIIFNDKGNCFVNMDFISSFNIHTNGCVILACFENQARRDIRMGEYSSKERCLRAFDDLIRAIDAGDSLYRCLSDNDPMLNTILRAGGSAKKAYSKTNGKTK